MATIMLYWFHEEPFSEFDSSWGEERAPSSIGGGNPWGLGRDKDCRLAFGFRGAASRMDNGSLGSNEDEFESLDPCGEPRGFAGITTKPRPGRPTGLEAKMQKTIAAHLEKSPQDFGLNRAQWDGPTLVIHLKRHLGITLKVRQAQRWMHHLGYRLKRGGYIYLQAKAEEARKFRRALKKT